MRSPRRPITTTTLRTSGRRITACSCGWYCWRWSWANGPKLMLPFSWDQFYDLTRSAPPWPLLQRAVRHLEHKGDALDLGAGAGRDTIYLLEQGFNVTAVDRERGSMTILE